MNTATDSDHVIRTPGTAMVMVTCPNCDAQGRIVVQVHARVTKDSDGTSTLGVRVKAPKLPHDCAQTALPLDG